MSTNNRGLVSKYNHTNMNWPSGNREQGVGKAAGGRGPCSGKVSGVVVVLLQGASESPVGLVITQIARLWSRVADSVGLG